MTIPPWLIRRSARHI